MEAVGSGPDCYLQAGHEGTLTATLAISSSEMGSGSDPEKRWKKMARPKRFELLTPRFVVRIILPYGVLNN